MARKRTQKGVIPQTAPAKKSVAKASKKQAAAGTKKKSRRKKPGKQAARVTRWSAAEIEEAFRRFHEANPQPQGELNHVNPYTLLIAVVLSAQATDAGVNKATPALFALADTPEKMVALGEDRVRELVKTIGLYRTKAKNVILLSQKLIDEHAGTVPRTREALEALPGVGRKTANVVLNIAFGEATIAVDTHLFRIGNRTGLAPGKTPLDVELGLEQVVPDKYRRHAHHWLILHGRYICVARGPKCDRCLINEECKWPEKLPPGFSLAERIATSRSVMAREDKSFGRPAAAQAGA